MSLFRLSFATSNPLTIMVQQPFVQETAVSAELRHQDAACVNESQLTHPWWYNFKYMAAGLLFGVVAVKGEIVSWFRIQEMFQLASFHMYGVIGTAVVVGAISILILRKLGIKTIYGEAIVISPKKFDKGQIFGGLIFGIGWAMTGACPGPLYALVGNGFLALSVTLLSAVAGTWVYGRFRSKLPH